MNKEELEWLLDIATPTGISYSGDQTITIDFANKVINYINKQKEVLDKIKEKVNKMIWGNYSALSNPEYTIVGKHELLKLSNIDLKDILELLEEIE